MRWSVLAWPLRWWAHQSLRARLTLIATALFAVAVSSGVVLALALQRHALLNVLDASALKTASDIARDIDATPGLRDVVPTTGGVTAVQVVDAHDKVIASSPGINRFRPILGAAQLIEVRSGSRIDITNPTTGLGERVLAQRAGVNTVIVAADLSRIDDSIRVLTQAALIGGPLAVLVMGLATYVLASLTLRPVASLRHGAADITAAGLADQRLPLPSAQDEIHRLAVTLNAMLDRIDSATKRQRTFVGDAAHELRSPLASLRVQLEVSQRVGPDTDWSGLIDDVLVDVSRLDRLVEDLLDLARMDERAIAPRREDVRLDELVAAVAAHYAHARVPVIVVLAEPVVLAGDPDALRRVVVNLTDNALRYARTCVSLTVTHQITGDRSTAVLTVIDDGPGIPPEETERVFDRFYRLEQSRSRQSGGTGLGLPIVRDLVRAHGGSVRLRARTDKQPGLRAVVRFPLDRDP